MSFPGAARSGPGAARMPGTVPRLFQMPKRCSPDSHFHEGASEAKRSEAVLTYTVSVALVLLGTFLNAFQFFNT